MSARIYIGRTTAQAMKLWGMTCSCGYRTGGGPLEWAQKCAMQHRDQSHDGVAEIVVQPERVRVPVADRLDSAGRRMQRVGISLALLGLAIAVSILLAPIGLLFGIVLGCIGGHVLTGGKR